MFRFIVITDPDRAVGFRLAGVDVFEVSGQEMVKKIVQPLLYKDDIGIVAVNEEYLLALDNKVMDRIEKMHRPIVIPIPSKAKSLDRASYVERLLKKAIGYNIVLRR